MQLSVPLSHENTLVAAALTALRRASQTVPPPNDHQVRQPHSWQALVESVTPEATLAVVEPAAVALGAKEQVLLSRVEERVEQRTGARVTEHLGGRLGVAWFHAEPERWLGLDGSQPCGNEWNTVIHRHGQRAGEEFRVTEGLRVHRELGGEFARAADFEFDLERGVHPAEPAEVTEDILADLRRLLDGDAARVLQVLAQDPVGLTLSRRLLDDSCGELQPVLGTSGLY